MVQERLRLGQLLVDARMLTEVALDEVLARQKQDGRRLGTLLVEGGYINETQLTQILSHQLSVPWVSLLHIEFSRQLLNLVPKEVAEQFCLVPIYVRHVRGQGQTLYVAMDDPTNEEALQKCQAFSGLPVRAMIAPPTDVRNAIRVYYGGGLKSGAYEVVRSAETPAAKPVADAPRARRSERPPRSKHPAAAAPAALEVAIPPPAPLPPIAGPLPSAVDAPREADASSIDSPSIDSPSIETRELNLSPRAAERVRGLLAAEEAAVPAAAIPEPRGRAPRMVSLTLLDGTSITLPAAKKKKRGRDDLPPPSGRSGKDDEVGLTARDLVAALRAVSQGADATEVQGANQRWETLFAALLSLLLKKHLIADWEFVEELKKLG